MIKLLATFDELNRFYDLGGRGGGFWGTPGMHKIPEFYKHDWWIFWRGSEGEEGEFVGNSKYRMSTHEAIGLMDYLRVKGEVFFIYVFRRPRFGAGSPFDPSSTRWKGVEWAPAYEDDADPVSVDGHK
ncbi:hypothetical protein [Alcanivorax hongdengensis]|uniref:hypothetical protein n=1 Tax=Alcanivorax hongdengensis TaxID=519051 RepID=UPI0012F79EBC|nr:hypothetical protein [Alcanivorax hongdengensis]